jgi:hypothetical protein
LVNFHYKEIEGNVKGSLTNEYGNKCSKSSGQKKEDAPKVADPS